MKKKVYSLFFVLFLSLLFCSASSSASLKDNVVLVWELENSTMPPTDVSGNNIAASYTGSPQFQTGGGFNVSGGGGSPGGNLFYTSSKLNDYIKNTDSFTFEIWADLSTWFNPGDDIFMLGDKDVGTFNYYLSVQTGFSPEDVRLARGYDLITNNAGSSAAEVSGFHQYIFMYNQSDTKARYFVNSFLNYTGNPQSQSPLQNANTTLTISGGRPNGQGGDASLKHILRVALWNRTLDSNEIQQLYNNGNVLRFNAWEGQNVSVERIVFNSQTPSNLNAINIFGTNLFIEYNFSIGNLTNVRLNYSVLGNPACFKFINGSCVIPFNASFLAFPVNNLSFSNFTLFNFSLDEEQIYTENSNLNASFFNNELHSSFNLANTQNLLSVEFLNVSKDIQFNLFETMSLSSAPNLPVFLCNSSYNFASNVASNTNCAVIGNINSNKFNYTINQSGYNQIPFQIINGKLSGTNIQITDRVFFIHRGAASGTQNISYISRTSRVNSTRTSTNTGSAWTIQTYSADTHLHQFPLSNSFLRYQAEGTYDGVFNASSFRNDIIEVPGFAPTPPPLLNPFGQQYNNRSLNISWLNATNNNPLASNLSYYGLVLLNADLSFNRSIQNFISLSTNSFNYDLFNQSLTLGVYYVRIYVNDSLGISSFSESYFNLTADTEVRISAFDSLNNASVLNFSVNITDSFNNNFFGSTASGIILFGLLKNTSYNMTIDAPNYALKSVSFSTSNSTSSSVNVSLDKSNSISINIFSENTGELLVGVEVNLSIEGVVNYKYSTLTGHIFASNLTAGFYELKFTAVGYSPKSYFITITNRTTQTLNAFLSFSFQGIGVYVKNTGDEPLPNSSITIQRYINGSFITIAQGFTDGIGYNLFNLQEGITYLWTISSSGFENKQFQLIPYNANQPYIFKLVLNTTKVYLPFNQFVSYTFTPRSQRLDNVSNQVFTFTTLSTNGTFGTNSILWSAMNCGGTWDNVSGSPSGSTLIQSLDLSNLQGQTLTCQYGLQVDSYVPFYFSNTFLVQGFENKSTSLVNVANDVIIKDTPKAWLGILAMFFIAAAVLITYEFSKEARDLNLVVSTIGFMVLFVCAFLGFVSFPLSVILLIEAGLLYYANRGGY